MLIGVSLVEEVGSGNESMNFLVFGKFTWGSDFAMAADYNCAVVFCRSFDTRLILKRTIIRRLSFPAWSLVVELPATEQAPPSRAALLSTKSVFMRTCRWNRISRKIRRSSQTCNLSVFSHGERCTHHG